MLTEFTGRRIADFISSCQNFQHPNSHLKILWLVVENLYSYLFVLLHVDFHSVTFLGFPAQKQTLQDNLKNFYQKLIIHLKTTNLMFTELQKLFLQCSFTSEPNRSLWTSSKDEQNFSSQTWWIIFVNWTLSWRKLCKHSGLKSCCDPPKWQIFKPDPWCYCKPLIWGNWHWKWMFQFSVSCYNLVVKVWSGLANRSAEVRKEWGFFWLQIPSFFITIVVKKCPRLIRNNLFLVHWDPNLEGAHWQLFQMLIRCRQQTWRQKLTEVTRIHHLWTSFVS